MIGIENIGVYIPENRQNNFSRIYDGEKVDAEFIKNKVGFIATSRKNPDEDTSDMCKKAFENLKLRAGNFSEKDIECILVCSHNGDFQMPHTSAILQDKLSLNENCAAFDVRLACSGYVYSVNILKSFMEQNGFSSGVVFTCDPCSKILNPADKSADLILGDAATATLLGTHAKFELGKSTFTTNGKGFNAIIKRPDVYLSIDNRRVFKFVLRKVVGTVKECLKKNCIDAENIDLYIFHQASKYVVEELGSRLELPPEKVPFKAQEYGNTISSSLPLILQDYLNDTKIKNILMCGFGAGMSAAAATLQRL